MIDGRVCVFCVNRGREICLTKCSPEGKFRYLEPESLGGWEPLPELPPFREVVEMQSYNKLAIIYLAFYYLHAALTQDA